MKRIIILLYIFFLSTTLHALEQFDECGELYNILEDQVHKLSLDKPFIPKDKGFGIFFKDDLTQTIPYKKRVLKRTKENKILLESMLPQIYEKTKVEPNKIILELNGKKVETLSDKQIFNENEKKKMLVKFDDGEEIQFLNKEYNIKFILVNFETREVDEIDSKLSRYKVSFMHTLVWNDERITELGRKVFDKASLISEKNQNKSFFCQFTKEEFQKLKIYEPDIILANKVSFEGDSTEIVYEMEFYPKESDDDYDYVEIRKEIDGIGTFKSNFNFKSFPFDSQDIIFRFQNNYNTLTDTYRIMPYFSNYTVEELKRGFSNLQMQEWEKKSIDYNYFYVKDVSMDTYQVGISYITNIERNYMYFLSKIYLPIIIILLVSWSVFWINPKEIEARLTVSIVCLLSLIAYTFIVDKDLPKLSYLTIMDFIILLSYFFSSIPTIGTIYVNLFNNDNVKVKRIDNFFKFFIPFLYLFSFILICTLIIMKSPNTISALKF